jgi:hypothetical protein
MPATLPRLPGLLLLALGVCQGQEAPPEPVTFHAQTRLVLLSFHVTHGKNYATDLKPADVVLLEDGKPREFTIFDSPATLGRMPLELVILFDTNPRIEYWRCFASSRSGMTGCRRRFCKRKARTFVSRCIIARGRPYFD